MIKIIPFLFFLTPVFSMAQTEIPLYPDGTIPNSIAAPNKEWTETISPEKNRVHNISVPTLTVFLPTKELANGKAMIICPGGGYSIEAMKSEGFSVAQELNKAGISCFVLKYRLPNDTTMGDKNIGPLQDAQRAIQLVRENYNKWHLLKNKIGIMGFSAGGHLASTAGTHFEKEFIANPNSTSLRPDLMVLVYPVINLSDSLMHKGSRDNLLGKKPSQDLIDYYSNDLQITKKTPPTFLIHAKDDGAVKVANSTRFYDALQKNDVPSDIYLYEKGGHGFGLNNTTSSVKWTDKLIEWLKGEGWL